MHFADSRFRTNRRRSAPYHAGPQGSIPHARNENARRGEPGGLQVDPWEETPPKRHDLGVACGMPDVACAPAPVIEPSCVPGPHAAPGSTDVNCRRSLTACCRVRPGMDRLTDRRTRPCGACFADEARSPGRFNVRLSGWARTTMPSSPSRRDGTNRSIRNVRIRLVRPRGLDTPTPIEAH